MLLTLTPLASDSFDYIADPLPGPAWAAGYPGSFLLQALDGYCEAAFTDNAYAEYTGVSLPNDQFVSATVKAIDLANGPDFILYARATSGGFGIHGYELVYISPTFFYLIAAGGAGFILTLPSTTISAGDTLTLACVGTQISVLYNGTIIGQVTDTSFSSGNTFLGIGPDNLTDLQISNFTVGSAAASSGGSGVFLGSVLQVSGPPNSSIRNGYLGKVTVIASPPSGVGAAGTVGNPCLGSVIIASEPPAGFSDAPPLGEVCIIASAPAITPNPPFLGTVTDS